MQARARRTLQDMFTAWTLVHEERRAAKTVRTLVKRDENDEARARATEINKAQRAGHFGTVYKSAKTIARLNRSVRAHAMRCHSPSWRAGPRALRPGVVRSLRCLAGEQSSSSA